MILKIANLGAVKQIDIDLSKKYVLFCGPNSTGKTYVSYVLYAFLSSNSLAPINCFKYISSEINKSNEFQITPEYINTWLKRTCNDVITQMGSIFGIAEDTKDKLFGKLTIDCIYDENDYQETINFPIDITVNDGKTIIRITKKAESDIIKFESNNGKEDILDTNTLRTYSILNNLFSILTFSNNGSARMLTVERNSIYTFKTELALSRNEIIDRIQQNNIQSELDILDIINSSSRRYPLAVRTSLRVANDLDNIQKQTSEYEDVAKLIESDLLHGEVSMTKNGDVEFHSDSMPKYRRLPFHLSSSIVKTMASLVVYLKHLARKGDTLIVDEPEMNFHPDVQIILARIFAKLSNRGLKIIISTHSDYIIRETNNMIMAGVLINRGKIDMAKEIGYENDIALDKSNVEVLFFHHKSNSKSVTVSSLPIENDGFEVSTIDNTIISQNQRAEGLYDCLNEIKEN